MFSIKKEVSDIKRFNEIVLILLEEEFGYILDKIKIRLPLSKKRKAKIRKTALSPEQRLRETFERLGPTFIKLGQLLSVRPDLVPLSYISELEKLQDHVPSFSFDKVEEILLREFKKPIKNIFLKFEQKPIASASISQVHRAILRDGTKVAVKIQRPNIMEIIHTDIELMFFFARLIEKHVSELRKYRTITIVNEFAEWTKRELDFRVEARNAQVFREMFKENKSVHIPKVYPEYTTSSVLTLEYLNGVPIHQLNKLRKKKWFNITTLMNNGFNAMLTQIYINGFFHADPHPSNILILKNSYPLFLVFIILSFHI
jgi:ubiquinone biosynthesis protein